VIANAVANALGVEPRVLPLSPSRVWELIQERQQSTP
jgi:CO/xanthine dehydrogenase Mo-binding subunit